jgi:Peptidase C13 family
MNLYNCLRLLVISLSIALIGCASSPYQKENKLQSDSKLSKQVAQAKQQIEASKEPRILYAGFAMHAQSKAFRQDVLLASKAVLSMDPNAVVFKLANPVVGQDADFPYATRENIEQVINELGSLARPQDKIVLLFTTHGNRGILAINAGNQDYREVSAYDLKNWLNKLNDKPVVLALSACYSGSFIDPLKNINRIILTAADKDRNSFGCNYQSSNTFFVEETFGPSFDLNKSLLEVFDVARANIDRKEKRMNLSPASNPQIEIGAALKKLASTPLSKLRDLALD